MELKQLEKIGIKEKEAKIYIALLKEGSSLANQLAKNTNILRTSIYDYLDILLDKGLITYSIKNGKKYFQAVEPEKILEKFEEQKTKEETAIKELIPQLSKIKGLSDKKAKIEIFEGKEGMKTAMSRILKDNPKEFFVYGSSGVGYKVLPFYLEHWHNQRVKQKMKMKIIYNKTPESEERIKRGPSLKSAQIKFIEVDHASLTGTIIYQNKILLTIWNIGNPLAISIESQSIAQTYKDNFQILWKSAKP